MNKKLHMVLINEDKVLYIGETRNISYLRKLFDYGKVV